MSGLEAVHDAGQRDRDGRRVGDVLRQVRQPDRCDEAVRERRAGLRVDVVQLDEQDRLAGR